MSTQFDKLRPSRFQRPNRAWRRRFLPVAVWCGAIVAIVVLAGNRTHYIDAVGLVEQRDVAVSPLYDGRVQGLSVDLLDSIEEGQTLGVMDDTLVRAELIRAEAELAQLRAELGMTRQSLAIAQSTDTRRFVMDEEEARLDYLDRLADIEANRVTLQNLKVMVERQQRMAAAQLLDQMVYDETRLRYETLQAQLGEQEAALALATERMETTKDRREAWTTDLPTEDQTAESLAMLQDAIDLYENRIVTIQDMRKSLVLAAPVDGQISAVLHRPGETVLTGDPLLTITPTESRRVLAYVDERSVREFQPGDPVEIHTRRSPKTVIQAKVVRVGTRVEELPIHLRRNAFVTEWGLPILLGELPEAALHAGEAVDVRLLKP